MTMMISWSFVLFLASCHVLLCHGGNPAYYSIEQKDDAKNIALTFDDGPHGTLTPRLLDSLKAKGAKATFFVMGIKADLHPDIVKRAVDEGHEVANHAWNHPVISKISHEDLHTQLTSTTDAIIRASGKAPAVMRPPYGNTNPRLNEHIQKNEKLEVIIWSLDTLDWQRPAPDKIVKETVARIKPGAVILCHDIHPGTLEAIPVLIDELKKIGYTFKTVSEMIANKK